MCVCVCVYGIYMYVRIVYIHACTHMCIHTHVHICIFFSLVLPPPSSNVSFLSTKTCLFFTAKNPTPIIKNSIWFHHYLFVDWMNKEQMRTNLYGTGFKQVENTNWHEQKIYCDNLQGKHRELAQKGLPNFKSYWVLSKGLWISFCNESLFAFK